jgi:hypothetical protein
MLPQTNAALVEVHGQGVSEDYDQPAGPGPLKWSGRAFVYLRQREERVAAGGASSVVVTRTLIVPRSLDVDWQEGDTLTIDTAGQLRHVEVRGVERFDYPAAETRLLLEDA